MNTTNILLDKYLKVCLATQDKEIATRLRIRQSTVSNWRAGRAHPDAESIEKMAKAIGEPVGPWLASIEAERARSPANRMVWLRLAATLGAALALALTLYGLLHPGHGLEISQAFVVGICINALIGMAWWRLLTKRSFGHALRGIARPA